MSKLPNFRTGQSSNQAHNALKISVAILDQAQHCAVLWFGEIMRRKLYSDLGFSSMRQYAIEALGFSSTRAGDFTRLAAKLEALPVVKQEVAARRLGYTRAREIAAVADAATEKEWLRVAREKSRRELEETVRLAKKVAAKHRKTDPDQGELMPTPVPDIPVAVTPVRVGFDMTPTQYARYEALMAKIGHRGAKAELLLEAMEALLETDEVAPRGATTPHYQIHIHECPTCAKTTVQTPAGEQELSQTEIEAIHCDAQVHRPGKRNTSTIPPKTRREVLARDRHQCRRRGCDHTRFLHLHHIVPRRGGGANDPENLVTLCSACHDLWHRRGGDLRAMLKPLT